MADDGQEKLDRAFDGLEREAPDRVARLIRWLRDPASRWIRIPVGVVLILQGFLFFLPVAGIEFVPVGLLLIAQDVPFLKRPVGNAMLSLEEKWARFRERRHKRKQRA